ncbi:hypothetical protein AVEN_155160-1 [Araneus ventricosus]|uniref:Uncharacterized protein n=1 Tax=Araneus ventricosus TaxID=182803 RepID=A0A4Y2X964_ARAVE|nr:hypothetical protein AVEN_155160-1 [Araneus ventricosus]
MCLKERPTKVSQDSQCTLIKFPGISRKFPAETDSLAPDNRTRWDIRRSCSSTYSQKKKYKLPNLVIVVSNVSLHPVRSNVGTKYRPSNF